MIELCSEREVQWVLSQQNNRAIADRAAGKVDETEIEKELKLLKAEREARVKRNALAKKASASASAASATTP